MNEPEAFQLLTLASARDNRAVSPSIAKVWADDLSDVTLVDATVAIREHYREKPDVWLLPGHVLAGAKKIWAERARKWRIQQQIEARTEDKPFPMMTLAQAVEIEKQRTLDREKQSRLGDIE